jgi:hypothetical protein
MSSLVSVAVRVWMRFFKQLTERNDRALAAWGSSLQYKRRYTNPDDAKLSRRQP